VIGKAILPFLLAGYNVLAIDLRNHGNSQDAKPISLGLYEVRGSFNGETLASCWSCLTLCACVCVQSDDVLAAVDWLRANADELDVDPERVGLWGESMGAATSILACQKDSPTRRIKAVVADSSYLNARGAIAFRCIHHLHPALRQCPRRRLTFAVCLCATTMATTG
jgi:pimeloyl-ACP methyl ester carboxylesterase